jgi:simple sugar transport system ATP-binding protein
MTDAFSGEPKQTSRQADAGGGGDPGTRSGAPPVPLIELRGVSKYFGNVVALRDVSMAVFAGEVMCLLGDNGAGKSTLIKCLSGVHPPDEGELLVDGRPVSFRSPREALEFGIATVYQDLAMIPLMSIARNFFLGSEPTVGRGPFRRFDARTADAVTRKELGRMGIDVRDTSQAVGTLSGGERQSVAIARAVHFGARLLILDEPTSALGVKEAAIVLKYIARARAKGVGVIFITHNIHHAAPIGDRFTILNRGRSYGTFEKAEISREEMLSLMAGGEELEALDRELDEISDSDEHHRP